MTRETILLICLNIFFFSSYSQNTNVNITNPDPNQAAFTTSADNESVYTITGRRTQPTDKVSIDGSACFNENWVKGTVFFKNGKQFKNAELLFNLIKNQLYFKKNDTVCSFLEPVELFTLPVETSATNTIAVFRCGYPDFKQHSSNSFYQVINSGPNVHFIKYVSKKVLEWYQYSGPSKREYKTTEDLYLYQVENNQLSPINNKGFSIEKALPAYAQTVHELIKGQDLKHSYSEQEIANIINKINKLKYTRL